MKNLNINLGILLVGALCLMNIVACRKATGPEMNYGIQVVDSLKLSVEGQRVQATWEYSSNKNLNGFLLQIASDAAFTKLVAEDTLASDARGYVTDSAGFLDAYYLRVRSIANDIARNSEYARASIVFENVALAIPAADITANTAILKWNAPSFGSIQSIIVYPDSTEALPNIILSSDEITNRTYELKDLKATTHYNVLLFDGIERKGAFAFTTKD